MIIHILSVWQLLLVACTCIIWDILLCTLIVIVWRFGGAYQCISDYRFCTHFLPCNRDFALIERCRKAALVYHPEEWAVIVSIRPRKPFSILPMKSSDFKDLSLLEKSLKKGADLKKHVCTLALGIRRWPYNGVAEKKSCVATMGRALHYKTDKKTGVKHSLSGLPRLYKMFS